MGWKPNSHPLAPRGFEWRRAYLRRLKGLRYSRALADGYWAIIFAALLFGIHEFAPEIAHLREAFTNRTGAAPDLIAGPLVFVAVVVALQFIWKPSLASSPSAVMLADATALACLLPLLAFVIAGIPALRGGATTTLSDAFRVAPYFLPLYLILASTRARAAK